MRALKTAAVVVATVLLALLVAGPASAHVQVSPGVAAPNDAVQFRFLVPGERDTDTVKVVVAVPKDVLPFSYGDTPGWKRTLQEGADGSPSTITWTGRMAPDSFVEFSLLASTPPTAGDLAWKALQYYAGDSNPVRWIGAPGTEYPAPVTHVETGAAKQNAGGEGDGDTAAAKPETSKPDASKPAASVATAKDESDSDGLARVLAAAALLLAGAALGAVVALRRTRS